MKGKNRFSFERDLQRMPGQSVTEEYNELLDSKVEGYYFAFISAVMITAFSWISYFFDKPVNPYVVTLISILVIIFSFYRVLKIRTYLLNLSQGAKGERYVGQMLEELRADGYKIFHDVIGENFNVDHVLVGPHGIFVVETKTWGKNANIKNAKYDGKTLFLNNHAVPQNPIIQAQSCARWVRGILQKSVGQNFFVQPIIALPSKFIDPAVNHVLENENVYLINPKNIRSFINASKNSNNLSDEQINQIAFHLSRINIYKAD